MQKILKFIASLGLVATFAATAATEQYTIYLDTDGVTTGQCAAAAGLNGADARINITVNDSPKPITAVGLSLCNSSSFPPPCAT